MMKTSLEGKMAIIRHEGIVLSRYKDAVGVWTIGVGHTKNAGGVNPFEVTWQLSMAEVMDILSKDLVKFEKRVSKAVKVPISQHQFDALVSFDFNTGRVHNASLVKKLNAGDAKAAAAGFMAWTKAGGRKLSALVDRRKEERAIFERGAYPDPVATIYPASKTGKVQWSKGKRCNLLTLMMNQSEGDSAPPKPRPEPIKEPTPLPDEVIEDPQIVEDALRKDGSRTITASDTVEKVSLWSGFVATVKYAIDQVTDTLKDLPDWVWPVLIIAALAFIWTRSRKIKAARVDDAMSGKNVSRLDALKAFVRNR